MIQISLFLSLSLIVTEILPTFCEYNSGTYGSYGSNPYDSHYSQCYGGTTGVQLQNCYSQSLIPRCRVKFINHYLTWYPCINTNYFPTHNRQNYYNNYNTYSNYGNTEGISCAQYETSEGCSTSHSYSYSTIICWCSGDKCNTRENMLRIYQTHRSWTTSELLLLILLPLLALAILLCLCCLIFYCVRKRKTGRKQKRVVISDQNEIIDSPRIHSRDRSYDTNDSRSVRSNETYDDGDFIEEHRTRTNVFNQEIKITPGTTQIQPTVSTVV